MVVRYPGTNNEPNADYYGGENAADYAPDRAGRDAYGSSAREYAAAGMANRGEQGREGYGSRSYGNDRYGQREQMNRGYGQGYGSRDATFGRGYSSQGGVGDDRAYHGSYASDGRRFEDVGQRRGADGDNRYDPDRRYETDQRSYGTDRDYGQRDYRQRDYGQRETGYGQRGPGGQRDYGRQPQGYDYDDRGFFARAGDEVRSWFGDEDAERRRDMDARYDERAYAQQSRDHDDDYGSWRRGQIDALDRDYHEYRQENRAKFHNEFGAWRTERQGQRTALSQVTEHMEVVGSDGTHVGTVDKVQGDRILLTKNDPEAGGKHHSIPSRWIQTVEGKVTLSKTAADAKAQWQEEDRTQADACYGDNAKATGDTSARDSQGRVLGKGGTTSY